MKKNIPQYLIALSVLILLIYIALSEFVFPIYESNQSQYEGFNLEDALQEFPGISQTYDDNIYSIHIPDTDIKFSIDVEQNNISLEDGTILFFAQSVDIENSNHWLGDWVGSTYSYLDVQSNQTDKELYELGIRDEVYDIGNEDPFPISRAINSGKLECKFVSITIGRNQRMYGTSYKINDEYFIYYRHIDSTENIFTYLIYP